MLPNQTLVDSNNKQVALFPLEGFSISQPWWGTYSHEGGATYYATDFQAKDENGNLVSRAPCYAPVTMRLLYIDRTEAMALWQSVDKVHFADDTEDYLGLIAYHTGTGGTATGDHIHLETGKGEVNLSQYRYHFRDDTNCKRIVPDNALFVNDTFVTPYTGYNWKIFEGGEPTKKTKNKWLCAKARKINIRV